jgi:ribosomal-protein-alanine N-acetyltransferase
MQTFDTPRLHLRPLGEADEALYCQLYTDPELMRHIAAPMSIEAAQRSFRTACKQQLPQPQRWIISERATHSDIGLLGLIRGEPGPEIGVMLLAHGHGRGYGGESMAGMADRFFAAGTGQIICARQSAVDNPTVIRMMLRLGYKPLPPTQAKPLGGEWELTRDQWLAWRAEVAVATIDANR